MWKLSLILLIHLFILDEVSSRQINCVANATFASSVCECLKGFIGDPLMRCVSFKEACELNTCGDFSECISDESEPRVAELGAPYCVCEADTYGIPPNCRKRCTSHEDCRPHEYCNDDFCEDVCGDETCGPNAVCEARNNQRVCSCRDGYVPEAGLGCRMKRLNETNAASKSPCHVFCAEKADCEIKDEKIFCACSQFVISNPFETCEDFEVDDRWQGCDCCSDNLKPGCETPIDPKIIATLAG